jgi:carboxypeptidase Q
MRITLAALTVVALLTPMTHFSISSVRAQSTASLAPAAAQSVGGGASAAPTAWVDTYRADADHLIAAATADQFAWNRLAELTDTFGPRLSGSKNLQMAIQWAAAKMREDGFDDVRIEPVKVPMWVRGKESLEVVEPGPRPLVMLGLGGSVGTPEAGIEGEPLIVDSFDTLEKQSAQARGRIVVFNVPFTSYGETVRYRTNGASRAAQYGAVAMLVRAVGPTGLRTPHTGMLTYADNQPKIPAAAISAEDAAMLQRMAERGTRVRLRLKMEGRFESDADSANVVGEIRGRERPDEVVVVGGHIDSWDIGTGASDDGTGIISTWEAVRLIKKLNLKPRRTVRVVLWTNEENGVRGGAAYLARYRNDLPRHVMMLEADSGVFSPLSMGFSGGNVARAKVQAIGTLLTKLGIDRIGPSGGGADIGPSVQAGGIPSMALGGDGTRYFTIHHTPADTVDRVDPAELSRASAAIAIVTFVVADMPERLEGEKQETH